MKKVTVLGGGTGTFVVLSGIKQYPIDLGVIVSMMDSGGSTGRLRDQLGVLPPGDLRQSLLALSEASLLWRKLFLYRFENGDLGGHNFGNIFLSALEKVSDNYEEVIKTVSYVLKTKGTVVPVTFDKTHLCVEYESGQVLKSEGEIDEDNSERSRIIKAYLEPEAEAHENAINRIKKTDVLILGPGDLYTSIIPILLTNGIKDAVLNSHATIIYNLNMMTKAGQTSNYTAIDHITDLTTYLGREPDVVLVNNGPISEKIKQWYEEHEEHIVVNNLREKGYTGQVISKDLVDRHTVTKSSADSLTRSILRHDSKKLAQALKRLVL